MRRIILISACAATLSIYKTEGRFVFPDDPVLINDMDNTTATTTTTSTTTTTTTTSSTTNGSQRMINTYPDECMNEILDEKSNCRQDPSYPTARIIAMLRKSRSDSRLNSYFETNGVPLKTRIGEVPINDDVKEDFSRGRSQIRDEWANLCHETTTYQYPKLAKNKAGVPRFVVNSDGADELSEYRQKVKMTRCDGSMNNQEDEDVIHGNGGACETLSLVTGCRQ